MKLFTLGYELTGQAALLQRLTDAGVKTLIDVRELPNSRRAGFSKHSLAASLKAVGIDYAHFKALGTPKEGRLAHRRHDMTRFWQIVDAQLATPEADKAFEKVAAIAQSSPSCLLCLEADATICHRHRVAEELSRRYGFALEHLTVEAPSLL